MAQRTTVLLVDDLDGGEADQTVEFAVDGTTYEIDLSDAHAAELRDRLAGYIAIARRAPRAGDAIRTTGAPPGGSGGSGSADRAQNRAVRVWAGEHGHPLPERGRIPSAVTEAYRRDDPASLPARVAEPAPASPVAAPAFSSAGSPADPPADPPDDADRVGPDGLTRDERERIRGWAQDQGIEVKARGRLTRDLVANYRATTARTG